MEGIISGTAVRAGLVAGALLLDLLVVRALIDASVASAVCVERANFLMILCVEPPPEWQIALSGALALALAAAFGAILGSMRRPPA